MAAGSQPFEDFSYEAVKSIADYLLGRTKVRPKIGIICGSGLGSLANFVTGAQSFDYENIPNFPVSTVEGHAGKLIFGHIEGVPVVLMQGRFHHYEGYTIAKCSMPVRVMRLLGCDFLLATNAAGGINPTYKVGDIMLIRDHVNWFGIAGNSPLRGANDSRWGVRFPPVVDCYHPQLLQIGRDVAKSLGITNVLREGVYAIVGGPTYETVAELRMMHKFGVDALGMSTVHEVVIAKQCGMYVFAFSLITNVCPLDYKVNIIANHEEVVSVGKERQGTCGQLMMGVIREMSKLIKQ